MDVREFNNHSLQLKLTDEGTRYALYQDLLELWKAGFEILKANVNKFGGSEMDQQRLDRLSAGILLLSRQMEIMSDYDRKLNGLRAEINSMEDHDAGKTDDKQEEPPSTQGMDGG